jgi:hypothetical protein
VYLQVVFFIRYHWMVGVSYFFVLKLFSFIYCSYRYYLDSFSGGDKFNKILIQFPISIDK